MKKNMFQTQAMSKIFNRTSVFDEDDHPRHPKPQQRFDTRRYVPRNSIQNLGRHRPHHQAIRRRRYTRSLSRNPIRSTTHTTTGTTTTTSQNVRDIGNTTNNRSIFGRLLRIYSRIADFNSSHTAANIVTSNTTSTTPTTTTTTTTAAAGRAPRAPTPIPTSSYERWSRTQRPRTSAPATTTICTDPNCPLRNVNDDGNRPSTSSGFCPQCHGQPRSGFGSAPGLASGSGGEQQQQGTEMRVRFAGPPYAPPPLRRHPDHSHLHQIQHQRFVEHSNVEQPQPRPPSPQPQRRSVSEPARQQQQQPISQQPVSQQHQQQYGGNPNGGDHHHRRHRSSSITRLFAGLFTRRQRNTEQPPPPVQASTSSTAAAPAPTSTPAPASPPQEPRHRTFPHSFRCFCCGPFNCRICASAEVGPGGGQAANDAEDGDEPSIELGPLGARINLANEIDWNILEQAILNQPLGEQNPIINYNPYNPATGGGGSGQQYQGPLMSAAMQICCCNCCCGGGQDGDGVESQPGVIFRFVRLRPRRPNLNNNGTPIEPYMMDLPSASSLVSISQLESVSSANLITNDNRHKDQCRPSPIMEEESWMDTTEIIADPSTTTLSSSTFETVTTPAALPTPLISSEPIISTVQARIRSSSLGAVPISHRQQQQLQLQQQRSQQPSRTASSLSMQAVASFVSDNCISAQHHQTHTTSWLPPADVWDQINSVNYYQPTHLNGAGPTTAQPTSVSASISESISTSISVSASVLAQSSSSSSASAPAIASSSSSPAPICSTSSASSSAAPATTDLAPGSTSQSAYPYPDPDDIPGPSHHQQQQSTPAQQYQDIEQQQPIPVPSTSHAGLVLLAPPTIPAEQSTSVSLAGLVLLAPPTILAEQSTSASISAAASTNESQQLPVTVALPYGWELACDSKGQTYYINHLNCTSTYCTPLAKGSLNDPQPKPRMVTIKRDPQLGFGFVVGSDRPVIVRFVKESGPSETLLKPGDIIYQVNGQDITKSPRDHVINLIKSSTETVTLVVGQPVHDSRTKSSLMTEAKRARLRQNPRRVRFAEGCIVNGSPMFSSTMADSINCNCMSPSSGSSSSSSSSPCSPSSQAHTHEEGSCPLLDADHQQPHVHCCPYAIAEDHCCYGLSHMDFDPDHLDIPNVLKVFLENGQTKTFKYDGTTTVQNLVDLLCEKLTIHNCFYFGLVIEQVHNSGRVTCPHPHHKQHHHNNHHHHHHHPIQHVHHQQQQQSANNHHHHNHKHNVQNIVRFYGNNRLVILDPNDMIMNVVAKPNAHNLRCLFRLITALPNPLRMLENDPHSFEYFYHQCCNDLSLERFVPEIKYELSVRLATFHIFEYILSHQPAQSSSSANGWSWKNITEMHKKSFLKWLDREFGLQNFVPQSLYCSMKRKELIRLISHSFKMDQQLFQSMNPTLVNLSSLSPSASPPSSSSSSASSASSTSGVSGSYIVSASAPSVSSSSTALAPAPASPSSMQSDTVPMTTIIRALGVLNHQTIDSAAAMALKAKLYFLQKLSELPCYGAKVFSTNRIVPLSGPGHVVQGPSTPNRQSPTTKAGTTSSSSGGGGPTSRCSGQAQGHNGKNAGQPEMGDTSAPTGQDDDGVAVEEPTTNDQKDTVPKLMKITVLNESLIVNAKHGLCYMICSNPQQPITVVRCEDIVSMNILKNDQTFLFDIEIVAQESIFNKHDAANPNAANQDLSKFSLTMDSDDTLQFVLMVKSYHSLLLSKSNLNVSRIPGHLPLINCNWKMMLDQALIIVKWDCPPDWWVDEAPRYYGIHRVVGIGWNYGVFGDDPINAIPYILQFADENNFIEFPDRQMLFYNNQDPVPVPVPQQVPDQPEPPIPQPPIPHPVNGNYRQVDLSIPPPAYNEELAVQAQREQREQLIALNPAQIRSRTEVVASIDSRDSQLYAIEEMNQQQRQLSPINDQSVDIPSAISMDILESHGVHGGKLNQSPSMNNLMLLESGPSTMVMTMMDPPNNSNSTSSNYSQSNFDINQSDLSQPNSIVVQVDINHQAQVYNVEPIINMDNSCPLLVELPPSQYCYAHNSSTINGSNTSANIETSGDLSTHSTHSHNTTNATDGAIVTAMPTGYLPQLCMMENELRQMIESLDAASGAADAHLVAALQPHPPQPQQQQYAAENPHVQLVDFHPVLVPFATVDIGVAPFQQQPAHPQPAQPLDTLGMVGSNPPEVVVAELDSLCEKLNQMKMLNLDDQLDSNEFIDNLVIPPPPTCESPEMIEEQQKVIEKFHKATTDVQALCQERILEQQQQQQQRDQQLLHHYQEQWMRLVEEATNQHEHDQQLRKVKQNKLHRRTSPPPPPRPPLPDEVQRQQQQQSYVDHARPLKRSAHLNTSVDQGLWLLAQRQQQLLQKQSSSHPPPLSSLFNGPEEQDHERYLRESRHYSSLPALLNGGSHTIDGQNVGEPLTTNINDNHHQDEAGLSSLMGGATTSSSAMEQQQPMIVDRLSKLFFDQNPFHNQQYNDDGSNYQTIMATRPMAMFNYIRQKQPIMTTMQRSQSLNQISVNDGAEMAQQVVEQEEEPKPPERPPLPSSMNLFRSGGGGSGSGKTTSSSSHYLKPPIPPNHQPSSKEKRLRQKLQQQQKQQQKQREQQLQSQKQAHNDRKAPPYLMSLPVLAPPSSTSSKPSSKSRLIVQPLPPPQSSLPTEQRTSSATPMQTFSAGVAVANQAKQRSSEVAAAAAAAAEGGGYRFPCISPYEQAMSGSAPPSSSASSALWWNAATGGAGGGDSGRVSMTSSNGPLGSEYRQWLAKPGFVPHIYYGLAQRFNNMADTVLSDPPLKHQGHLLDFAYGTESKQACFQSNEMQDIFTQCQYDIDVLLTRLEEVHERRLSTGSGGHKMMLESLNSLNYHSNYNSNYNRLNGLVVKESLVVEARHFTTASKLFVKCATEASFQLIDFLTECVGLLERMFTISEDIIMMADIETQAQITCLVDRLKEVAVTYAYTVDVVRRLLENHHRPDRSINPYLDLLMNHAVSLATSLNTLIRTIRSMGLD